ncbi:MAG: 23S rRNA (guanosine(2251)-2'-O)-methyltransferase RlmB [Chloroflexi bacterium RBG_16_50_9]|nr:MAG: 23S rRNA (guanosine(2251)-2'-O)-methyltransferase RlmB [Chloroflexi bacterium RBG_16_50_9]
MLPKKTTSEIIEGRNPIIEALKSGRPLNKILLTRSATQNSALAEIRHLSRGRNIPIEFVPRDVIDRLSTTTAHQGIIAYVAAKEYVNLQDLITLSRQRSEPPLYCVLYGVEDPHNLGSIIRAAEASGVHGVIIRSRRAVGLTAAAAKASAGALEYLPVARVSNISQAIEILKKNGVWVVGLDPAGKIDFCQIDFRLPTAIIIGGEGKGLSDLVRKRCDYVANIPMRGKISSLNTSIAAALVMYEATRQRSRRP